MVPPQVVKRDENEETLGWNRARLFHAMETDPYPGQSQSVRGTGFFIDSGGISDYESYI